MRCEWCGAPAVDRFMAGQRENKQPVWACACARCREGFEIVQPAKPGRRQGRRHVTRGTYVHQLTLLGGA